MDKKYNTLGDILRDLHEAGKERRRLHKSLREANARLRIHIEELRLQRQSRESGNFPRPMSHAPRNSEFSNAYVPEWAKPIDR